MRDLRLRELGRPDDERKMLTANVCEAEKIDPNREIAFEANLKRIRAELGMLEGMKTPAQRCGERRSGRRKGRKTV